MIVNLIIDLYGSQHLLAFVKRKDYHLAIPRPFVHALLFSAVLTLLMDSVNQ